MPVPSHYSFRVQSHQAREIHQPGAHDAVVRRESMWGPGGAMARRDDRGRPVVEEGEACVRGWKRVLPSCAFPANLNPANAATRTPTNSRSSIDSDSRYGTSDHNCCSIVWLCHILLRSLYRYEANGISSRQNHLPPQGIERLSSCHRVSIRALVCAQYTMTHTSLADLDLCRLLSTLSVLAALR